DYRTFKTKIDNVIEQEIGDFFKDYDLKVILEPQLMRNIHLTSHFLQEYEANGDEESILYMTIIAFIIIIIAWVNYINLSTARAIKRAKEVGLRKVVGANKRQLIVQFFIETFLLNGIGFIIGLILIGLTFPCFCRLSGMPPEVSIWQSKIFYRELIVLIFCSIFLSGIYPILVQTSFKPIAVIRGKMGTPSRGIGFRKLLVLFQFSIAFVLLVATLTVFNQIKFMRNQSLGFNSDQILVIKAPRIQGDGIEKRFESFKDEVRHFPNITDIAFSSEVPGRQIYWDNGGIFPVGGDYSKSKNYMIMGVDYEFLNLYDMKFLAGRNFSKEFSSDPDALILSETAMHWLEFESPKDAVGRQIDYWGKIYTVIGVVADYHHQSPKAAFEPTIFRFMTNSHRGMYSVKLQSSDVSATLQQINTTWKNFFPDNPFTFFFLDDYFNEQYQTDERFGAVIQTFTGLALFVTCLGIFGLTAYNASQKKKEIGIRKVLGASVPTIVILLVKDLFYLVMISMVLMIPVSILGIRKWLQGFNCRMEIGIFLFVVPLIILITITGLTIIFQSLNAATTNPVETIKYE
ncbi:MAG: ABC transporter permease, partial [Candidatus Marinimicrobia bacterium]|nr:ABC transporter permease [Candidatus Neomarinimicrobiota bacterium]